MRVLAAFALLAGTGVVQASELTAVTTNYSTVVGGDPIVGTLVRSNTNPLEEKVVTLSDNTSAIETPATATFPQGTRFVNFNCTTSPVGAVATRVITASLDGITKSTYVTLHPESTLAKFELERSNVVGGEPIPFSVELTGPAHAPYQSIAFSSNSSAVSVGGLNIMRGRYVGGDRFGSTPVGAVYTRTIIATYAGKSLACSVTLHPSPKLLWMRTPQAHLRPGGEGIGIDYEIGEGPYPLTEGIAPTFRCTTPDVNVSFSGNGPTRRFGTVRASTFSGIGTDPTPRIITIEGRLGGATKSLTVLLIPTNN